MAAAVRHKKRSRRVGQSHYPTDFDRLYELMHRIYNVPNHSELQSKDDARIHFDSQPNTWPSQRHLLFRVIGTDEWIPTSAYSYCKTGKVKNISKAEKANILRNAQLRVPPELRQKNYLEERSIKSMIEALRKYCDDNDLPQLSWLYVPDGLRNADVLCRLHGTPKELFIALQFKTATHKIAGNMIFYNTSGYAVPMLCVALKGDEMQEVLLFPGTIAMTSVSIVNGKPSENPIVQAARHTTIEKIYTFLAEFPVRDMRPRNYWVYDKSQSSRTGWLGLLVQKAVEDITCQWVSSPSGQNKAVDGFIGDVAVSFKTATSYSHNRFLFRLGKSQDHHTVDAFVVGFRDGELITSLGVLPPNAVDRTKPQYYWSQNNPFRGTLGITNFEQLHEALLKHKR